MFKVGDAVRVKAGSPVHPDGTGRTGWRSSPWALAFGKKCSVLDVDSCTDGICVRVGYDGTSEGMDIRHLEPWNDSEEWDGEKWVPKKLADEITINGVTYIRKPVEKTKAEKIEQHFLDGVGEYAIFDGNDGQEVARATIVSVSRTGNRITVVYDAGE